MTTSSHSSPMQRPETLSGLAISLAFWLCLLLSAVVFGVVALSPKFLIFLQLRNQFDSNQLRLVALENQAGRLQKVIDAIRDDKDFASELTRIEFDAVRPDEEVIPVETALKLDARAFETQIPSPKVDAVLYEPLVRYVATEGQLRVSLLGFAALLVIVSFTMLQPAGVEQISSGIQGRGTIWRSLRNRYVR